jgi:hypothetical protein
VILTLGPKLRQIAHANRNVSVAMQCNPSAYLLITRYVVAYMTTIGSVVMMALLGSALVSGILVFDGDLKVAYADDDEDNIFGFRDRDREGSDDDERGGSLFGTDVSSLVLVGTIAAILGTVGYSGYKLLKIRQKKPTVPKGSSKPS